MTAQLIETSRARLEMRFDWTAIRSGLSVNFLRGDTNWLHITVRPSAEGCILVANDRAAGQWGTEWQAQIAAGDDGVAFALDLRDHEIAIVIDDEHHPFRPGHRLPPLVALDAAEGIDIAPITSSTATDGSPSDGSAELAYAGEDGLVAIAIDIDADHVAPLSEAESVAIIGGAPGVTDVSLHIGPTSPADGGRRPMLLLAHADDLVPIEGLILSTAGGYCLIIAGLAPAAAPSPQAVLDQAGFGEASLRSLTGPAPADAVEIAAIRLDTGECVVLGRAGRALAAHALTFRSIAATEAALPGQRIIGADGRFVAILAEVPAGDDELLVDDGTPEAPRRIAIEADGGLDAIVRLLDALPDGMADIGRGFAILQPLLDRLNRSGRDAAPTPEIVDFGAPIAAPRCSFLIPLYGRLDFAFHQVALFSAERQVDELVYILDQPDRRDEMIDLLNRAHAMFGWAIRLVIPPTRLGFGPASNLGLSVARGDYICFLNSDVFGATGWIDRLIACHEGDPAIGVVGARMLFADGSLQHGGMTLERIPGLHDWVFPLHPGKGLKPPAAFPSPGTRGRAVDAVTGACMLMRRERAQHLGGFDPAYIIGDFEDADLCARITDAGLSCQVVDDIELFHLERQSQGNDRQAWRRNLTMFNAWRFQGRLSAQ